MREATPPLTLPKKISRGEAPSRHHPLTPKGSKLSSDLGPWYRVSNGLIIDEATFPAHCPVDDARPEGRYQDHRRALQCRELHGLEPRPGVNYLLLMSRHFFSG